MGDLFEDRERGFEAIFAEQQAAQFRVIARRNRMLSVWAAELLGRDDLDVYATEVIAADFTHTGHDDVLRKLMRDFAESSIEIDEETVRAKMHSLLQVAWQQATLA